MSVFGLIMVGSIDWQQMLIDAVREVIPVWPAFVSDVFRAERHHVKHIDMDRSDLATLAMFCSGR